MRDVKRFLSIMTAIGALLLVFYLITMLVNEAFISQYKKKEYNIGYVSIMGFTEPYVKPYNVGCSLYQLGMYEEAADSFMNALQNYPPRKGDKDCKVRINLALAMVAQIDLDNINDSNIDHVIELLVTARYILCMNDCAHFDDEDGHNADAQTLKDEIDELLRQLGVNPDDYNEMDDPTGTQQTQGGGGGGGQQQTETETQTGNGGGETEMQTGESQTGEGESQTGEGESQTGEGETQTGEGESQTGEGESQTGEGESQTGEGETQTGEGETQTETQPGGGEQTTEAETESKSDIEQLLQSIQDDANHDRYDYNPDNYTPGGGGSYYHGNSY